MKKFNFGGAARSKQLGRGVLQLALAIGVLASATAQAQDLNCAADIGPRGIMPELTEIDVKVDKKSNVATGTWNGQSISTKIEVEEDNLAEFSFKGGAEAGIWESESLDETGAKKWTGFIFPSEESGMYRLKCAPRVQIPLAKSSSIAAQ